MKVLQTIEGIGARYGGIATSTINLMNALNKCNGEPVSIELLTLRQNDVDNTPTNESPAWLHAIKDDSVTPFHYSAGVRRYLHDNDADLYHVNGLWQYICHATAATARRKRKPYLFTPHGMLYPESLAISAWKKKPLRMLFVDRDIFKADCIHVSCEAEMCHIRNLGYTGPIAVISNPVVVKPYILDIYSDKIARKTEYSKNPDRQLILGYLGRLHPIKRIEYLLKAVAISDHCPKVMIIGTGDANYKKHLQTEATSLGIADRVEFFGYLDGEEKYRRLAQADAIFVPSDMENFGMIVPEALLAGTPVMASKGTPWSSLDKERCGWWTNNSPESIAKVIDSLYNTPRKEIIEMGRRGHEFVVSQFSSEIIARKMHDLYRWMLGIGDKPEYVYEN